MELAANVFNQVLIMFLLIAVGIFCYRIKLISKHGNRQLSNFLLSVVTPALIVNSYQKPFDAALAQGLLWAFLLAGISHLIGIAAAYLLLRGKPGDPRLPLERFAAIYSNCGFMAIPLISAVLGGDGVFYAGAYLTVFNLLSWTQGVFMLSGERSLKSALKVFTSPTVISVFVGLLLFFTGLPLPGPISSAISYISDLNTPLAMIVTGVSIAQMNIFSAFKGWRLYYVSLLRLVVVPGLMLAALALIPCDPTVRMVNLIGTACPAAASTVLFANRYSLDSQHASKLIAITTVFSLATIPLLMGIAGLLF